MVTMKMKKIEGFWFYSSLYKIFTHFPKKGGGNRKEPNTGGQGHIVQLLL